MEPAVTAEAGAGAPTGIYASQARSTPRVKSTGQRDWRDLRMNLLSEIDRTVRWVSDLVDLNEHVLQMIQHALRSAARAVLLLDESKKELLFELTNGKRHRPAEHIRLDAGSGIVGWVARNGKPLIINDTSKYRRFNKDIDQLAGYPSKSIICVPLIVRGKTIGVLEVLNKLDGSGFTEEDLATLVAVGSIAGMAIENTRLHRTVEEGYKSTIRALAVADVFDTMTTNRSYRSALDNSEALEELVRCSGTQFCPAAVDAFIASFRQNAKNGLLPNPAFCPR